MWNMFKVDNKDTRTTRRSGVFNANFEHISHCSSVSVVNFEHVIDGWDMASLTH